MNKIGLIIGREIKAKLSNRTYVIMTLLAPILVSVFMFLIVQMSKSEKTEQKVLVVDESQIFKGRLAGNDYISLTWTNKTLPEANKELIQSKEYTCILWIAPTIVDGGAGAVKLIYKKSPGFGFQTYIKNQLEKIMYEYTLRANNIEPDVIHNAKRNVSLILRKVDDLGNETGGGDFQFVGFLSGVLMFVFILLYGMMVFRSVMEEKTNRIVEVIVSSVKPFELMLGKIIGTALLGVIQFAAMSIITGLLSLVLSTVFLKDAIKEFKTFKEQQELVNKNGTNIDLKKLEKFDDKLEMFDLMDKIKQIDFGEVFIYFLLYFVGGYLFYSSIMAAIGSAVDSEADSQQFITPVMLPLIAGYVMAVNSMMNPDSTMLFWGSLIPFTSPIVMMARIPGGVPAWEVALSLFLLYVSFVFTTWLAARIYRTGILMYGKKTSWREIGKWLFYK